MIKHTQRSRVRVQMQSYKICVYVTFMNFLKKTFFYYNYYMRMNGMLNILGKNFSMSRFGM